MHLDPLRGLCPGPRLGALSAPKTPRGGTLDFYPYVGSAGGKKYTPKKYQNLRMHPKKYHTLKMYPKKYLLKNITPKKYQIIFAPQKNTFETYSYKISYNNRKLWVQRDFEDYLISEY